MTDRGGHGRERELKPREWLHPNRPEVTVSTAATTKIDRLASLLHETADRHHSFEAAAAPHDWWDWYAAYMTARQSGGSPDEAAESAARYMAEVKGVRPKAAA